MIRFSNLIQIIPSENRTSVDKLNHRHNQPTNNLLSYTREQLIQIRQQTKHNNLTRTTIGINSKHSKIEDIQEKAQNQKQKIIKNSTAWGQLYEYPPNKNMQSRGK